MFRVLWFLAIFAVSSISQADTYTYNPEDSVVGIISIHTIGEGDNYIQLAQKYRVGFNELVEANPGIDPWIPEVDTQIIIPTQYVLPNIKHEGVVINLAELRLYHFHEEHTADGKLKVSTFPISIGKGNWETPETFTRITAKQVKPSWYPPESIRKEHEENNDPLPPIVPPGPDNPLGDYSLRLALPGYLIHGTNVPHGIGMRVTHGCIRLHPFGIERLFQIVGVNTPVAIINQPYKVAWHEDKLFVETHSNVEEQEKAASRNLTEFVQSVVAQTKQLEKSEYEIYWDRGYQEAKLKRGIPFVISVKNKSEADSREVAQNF